MNPDGRAEQEPTLVDLRISAHEGSRSLLSFARRMTLRDEVSAALTAHSDPALQGLVSSSWDAGDLSAALTLSSQSPFVLPSLLTSEALSQLFRQCTCFFFTFLTFSFI